MGEEQQKKKKRKRQLTSLKQEEIQSEMWARIVLINMKTHPKIVEVYLN